MKNYPPPLNISRLHITNFWAVWLTCTWIPVKLCLRAGREGTLGCYYTCSQRFIITLSYLLAYILWVLLLSFISLFIKLSVQMFQPPIVIYRRDTFVCHHWGSTTIYRPLSYPFSSLVLGDCGNAQNKAYTYTHTHTSQG